MATTTPSAQGGGFMSLNTASLLMTAGGSILSAYEEMQAAKTNASILEYEARQAEKAGQQQAGLIRKQGKRVAGRAVAELARNTGFAGGGTGQLLLEEIAAGAETDAFNAILTGQSAAMAKRYEAGKLRRQSKNALGTSIVSTGLSLLSGGFM